MTTSSQVTRHTWSWTHDWADAGLLSCRCRTSIGPMLGRCWTLSLPVLILQQVNDAKQGINPSLGRCWAAESADVEPAWNQHWANDLKEGINPSLGDTGPMSLPMWNQHRANDAKEGMIPSLG